jgi:hypothetical protein
MVFYIYVEVGLTEVIIEGTRIIVRNAKQNEGQAVGDVGIFQPLLNHDVEFLSQD